MATRLVLFASVLAAMAGCGTGPDEEPIFGTYSLVSVEGNPVPYLDPSDPNCDIFISEGGLRLVLNGHTVWSFPGRSTAAAAAGRRTALSAGSTSAGLPETEAHSASRSTSRASATFNSAAPSDRARPR